jgi:hypothetical protein
MVLEPLIDPAVLTAILNSRGVRRQLIAQSRGAASLDIREGALAQVMVPRSLLADNTATKLRRLASEVETLRERLGDMSAELSRIVEAAFAASG